MLLRNHRCVETAVRLRSYPYSGPVVDLGGIMNRSAVWVAAVVCAGVLAGCSGSEQAAPSGTFQAPTAGATGPTGGSSTVMPAPSASDTGPSTAAATSASSSSAAEVPVETSEAAPPSVGSDGLPVPLTTPEAKRAEKFVRQYLGIYNGAVRDPGSVSRLDRFVGSTCKSCASLRSGVEDLQRNKQRYASDEVRIGSVVVRQGDGDQLNVDMRITQLPVEVLDAAGKVVRKVPEETVDRSFAVTTSTGQMRIATIKILAGVE